MRRPAFPAGDLHRRLAPRAPQEPSDLRSVAAFSGNERPIQDGGPHFCGTYNYEPAQIPATAGQSASGKGADGARREAALFDHPATLQRVPAPSTTDTIGEIKCTYYPDLLVRETGTDLPNPGNAAIVPVSGASVHPACTRAPAHGVPLKTYGYYLIGKKGLYLVFAVADPNGAQDFKVIEAGTGRKILADSRRTGFQSVAVENRAFHIRYTRAVNAPCSIVKEGSGCWAKLVQAGAVPACDGGDGAVRAGVCGRVPEGEGAGRTIPASSSMRWT